MKIYHVTSSWTHKGKKVHIPFVIACEDNQDPIEIIKQQYDMSEMEYNKEDSSFYYHELPYALHVMSFNMPFPKKVI